MGIELATLLMYIANVVACNFIYMYHRSRQQPPVKNILLIDIYFDIGSGDYKKSPAQKIF
jgi:hypothetical protein